MGSCIEDIQHPLVTKPVSRHVVTERTLLFQPSERDTVSFRNPKHRTGRIRKIFLNTPLEDEEQQWLANLRKHMANEDLQFHPSLEKEYLRYLQHARGNVHATVKLLEANVTFRKEFLSSLKDVDILDNLRSGFMYWHGRDLNERPVLVVRTVNLCQKKLKAGDIVRVVGFILEWMVRYGLVPGRVENWTVLVDLTDTSLTSISMETVKSLVTTLHMNYRFRNTKVVVMKCPWIGTAIYKLISPLLPADTKEKVTFCSSVKEAQKLLVNIIDPRQLEQQFGGTAPNCEKPEDFYPYRFFPDIEKSVSTTGGVPAAYLTKGKLWEDHDEAPENSTRWLEQCAINDFATPSSCLYLNAKFGLNIRPATIALTHIKALKSLFPATVEEEPLHSVSRSFTEPLFQCTTYGGESSASRNASLADAVIAKKGGSIHLPEELDKFRNAADKRTAEESEAESEALCLKIASMVNEGRIKEAICVVKDLEHHTEKSVQDNIALNSVTDAFHMVELKRVDVRPKQLSQEYGSELADDIASNDHFSPAANGKDVSSPVTSTTRHDTAGTISSSDPMKLAEKSPSTHRKNRDDDDTPMKGYMCCMRRRRSSTRI